MSNFTFLLFFQFVLKNCDISPASAHVFWLKVVTLVTSRKDVTHMLRKLL